MPVADVLRGEKEQAADGQTGAARQCRSPAPARDSRAPPLRRRSTRRWSCRASSSSCSANIPILFRRDADGGFQAVAILGLDRGENLFLSEGDWTARYVPATLRRGPLFLGVGDQDQPGDAGDRHRPRRSARERQRRRAAVPAARRSGAVPPAGGRRAAHGARGTRDQPAMFAQFAELDLIAPGRNQRRGGATARDTASRICSPIDAERFAGLVGR